MLHRVELEKTADKMDFKESHHHFFAKNNKERAENEILQIAKKIDSAIVSAKEIAAKNNKGLLVICGQKNDEMRLLIREIIAVNIAKKHNINVVATDMPREVLEVVQRNDEEELRRFRKSDTPEPLEYALRYAESNSAQVMPVGMPFYLYRDGGDIQKRCEQYMIGRLLEGDQEKNTLSKLFIVGQLYMLPLSQSEQLKKSFEMLFINLFPFTEEELTSEFSMTSHQRQCMLFSIDDKKVMQLKEKSADDEAYLDPLERIKFCETTLVNHKIISENIARMPSKTA